MIGDRLLTTATLVVVLGFGCALTDHSLLAEESADTAGAAGKQLIVVRPEGWQNALGPWIVHRQRQGFEIHQLNSDPDAEALQRRIRALCEENPASERFLLLAGDVDPNRVESIPTFYRQSQAMVQFGGDPLIATDHPYADLDDDDLPDLAMGRIPADSPAQLAAVVQRIIAYESQTDYSPWRRDVHVVAGVGGFGAIADSVIEMTTRRFLADRIPGWSRLTMTQASMNSHYCPDPLRFSEECLNRMNEGGTFWVYIGHGHVVTLDRFRTEKGNLPILNVQHVPAVDAQTKPPVAIFLACYTGAFDANVDSLAESLMLKDGGPIAAIAASRVSGPYGLANLSHGLLRGYYTERLETLGQVLLQAKQAMLKDDPEEQKDPQMVMIGSIASALSPEGYDLRAERLEHVWQMQLLGDPTLHLSYPDRIQLQLPDRAVPGESIQVAGSCAKAGALALELAIRRDQVRRELDTLQGDLGSQAGRDLFQTRYHSANDRVIKLITQDVEAGDFATTIDIPEDLPKGKYAVRAYMECDQAWCVGYGELSIRPPRSER